MHVYSNASPLSLLPFHMERGPATDSSLYDGEMQYHVLTSSEHGCNDQEQIFHLASSPPATNYSIDAEMAEDWYDGDTDMEIDEGDTDVDECDQPCEKLVLSHSISGAQRAFSQNSGAQAVAHRSFSDNELTPQKFVDNVVEDPSKYVNNGILKVEFSDRGITEIPSEIRELDHVVFHEGHVRPIDQIQMFFSGNELRSLPLSLFDVHSITVLSLRRNKLRYLPPAICKLTNLVELHVGNNKLEYLPNEILNLPIRTLTCRPNPLRTKGRGRRSIDKLRTAPSLVSLCTSVITNLTEGRPLSKHYIDRLPINVVRYLSKAAQKYNMGIRCCYCNCFFDKEAVKIVVWQDIFNQQEVPFSQDFCTPRCYYAHSFPLSSDAEYGLLNSEAASLQSYD